MPGPTNNKFSAKYICASVLCILLLIASVSIGAEEVTSARLIRVENLDNGPYQKRLAVLLGLRVEHLLVSQNPNLNDLHIVDSDGIAVQQNSVAYAGIVESRPNSWARVVVDGNYIAGTIQSSGGNTHFTSESGVGHSPESHTATLTPLTPPPASAINEVRRTTLNEDELTEVSVPVNDRLTATIGDVTRVIRVGVVIDALYQEAIAGRGLSKAIATMNSVDGLYRENFGLALKTDVIVLITDEATLPLNGDTLEDNLNIFRDYRIASELLPDDLGLVHLFSGVDSRDEAVGLAFAGAACRTDGYDVSLARPFLYAELLTAHEIGHNLGADHDDATAECAAIQDHLMFSAIDGSTTPEFSSCSSDAINTRMQQSTCLTAVIDIDLAVVQLESNQIQFSVTNLDATRAFPSATLAIDLKNAAIAEAPALCELEDPTKLTCVVPATFAGDTQDFAVKLRFEPDLERTVTVRLEANGFFDLNESNNAAELVIPGEPLPLASTDGELSNLDLEDDELTLTIDNGDSGTGSTVPDDDPDNAPENTSTPDRTPTAENAPAPVVASAGGGGTFGSPLLWVWVLLCACVVLHRRRT